MAGDSSNLTRWYAGERLPGVHFQLNDAVVAPGGDVTKDLAAVISLECLVPEVTFLIERSDGRSEIAKQSELLLLLYMPMLDEGTDVWRPIAAQPLGHSMAQVCSETPDDESWQYPTGARIVYEERELSGGPTLVVTGLAR
jgi:hypothetical protein